MLAVNVAAPLTVIGALRFNSYSLNSAARVRERDWACPTNPAVVRATLFENLSPITAALLSRNIETVIKTYEPRVELSNIKGIPNIDRNAYDVRIEFFVVNSPGELVTLDVLLERVR